MTSEEDIWKYLEEVPDPEIPVISVIDLGVVRAVEVGEDGGVRVTITPTYSGCPAMNEIATGIRLKLLENGFRDIQIVEQLSPAWTTGWLSEAGKEKMKAYGIAPPLAVSSGAGLFEEEPEIECPQCGSTDTEPVSQFGSTACKALYQCRTCREPFDYFKCHQ